MNAKSKIKLIVHVHLKKDTFPEKSPDEVVEEYLMRKEPVI